MTKAGKFILITALVIVSVVGLTVFMNGWNFAIRKADDATNYETLKEVEDTCRAMITSYTADKMRYETYAASDSPEKQSWAEQAKIRANATAAKYNEYILKNSFVWKDNVPDDIAHELEYIS